MDLTAFEALGSPATFLAICLIVALAATVQTGIGMGFGLTAGPLLALIDPALVPGPSLILSGVTSILAAWSERGAIRWGEVGGGVTGRFLGLILALAILSRVTDERGFMLFFGLLVVFAVILSVSGLRIAFTRANLIAVSTVSGVMAAITSVGAPPLALIYQHAQSSQARPTLATIFAFGSFIALAGLWAFGHSGPHDVALALAISPAMMVGMVIGRRTRGRFDRRFRLILLGVSGIAGLLLIARGLS